MQPNRSGNAGQYLSVLNWLSLIGVVVAHVRAAVAAADAEEREQLDDRVRGHRRPAVGVHGELAGRHLWRATASAMSSLASSPDSHGATNQATT